MNSPILDRHPLDGPAIKFPLGESVSAALAALGKYHLLVSAPADATTPEHLQGRRILHAITITQEQADDLHRLVTGTHRIVKVKLAKS